MADLIHEQMAPLAWDSDGMPFQWPSGTVALKIRVYTGQRGRPPNFWDEHGVAHLAPEATMGDLRAKVKNQSGDYRLYPVSATGEEMEPVACIKLMPMPEGEQLTVIDDEGSGVMRPPTSPIPVRAPTPSLSQAAPFRSASTASQGGDYFPQAGIDMMYMFGRFMDQQEKRDAQLTQMMQTLVESTASVQRSTAEMIQVNNSTVQVASGLDALERIPEPETIDEEILAEKLAELLEYEESETEEETKKPGFGDRLNSFLSGPMGSMVIGMVGGYGQGLQRAMDAKLKTEVATARAEEARADAIRAQAEAVQAKAERLKSEVQAGLLDDDDEIPDVPESHHCSADPDTEDQATAPIEPEPGPVEKPASQEYVKSPDGPEDPITADSSSPVSIDEASARPHDEQITTDQHPNIPTDATQPPQTANSLTPTSTLRDE